MVHELRARGQLRGSSACVLADAVVSWRRYKENPEEDQGTRPPFPGLRLQTPLPTLPAAGQPADTSALLKEENN